MFSLKMRFVASQLIRKRGDTKGIFRQWRKELEGIRARCKDLSNRCSGAKARSFFLSRARRIPSPHMRIAKIVKSESCDNLVLQFNSFQYYICNRLFNRYFPLLK